MVEHFSASGRSSLWTMWRGLMPTLDGLQQEVYTFADSIERTVLEKESRKRKVDFEAMTAFSHVAGAQLG